MTITRVDWCGMCATCGARQVALWEVDGLTVSRGSDCLNCALIIAIAKTAVMNALAPLPWRKRVSMAATRSHWLPCKALEVVT